MSFVSTPVVEFIELIKQNQRPCMTVAEIGVFDGSTTFYAIDPVGEMNGTYIAIDWFKGTQHPGWERGGHHSYHPNKDVYDVFKNNMKESKYFNNLKILRKTSEEAVSYIDDESLDICFIDADHSYLAVKRDISLYLPKVKHGGILCGHDFDDHKFMRFNIKFSDEQLALDMFNGAHVGVIKAVYDNFGIPEVLPNADRPIVWIYRKPIMLKDAIFNLKKDNLALNIECAKNDISSMLKDAAAKDWGGIEYYFTDPNIKKIIVEWLKQEELSIEEHNSSVRIFI